MQRRSLLKSSALAAGALLGGEAPARGALPKMKITRIRYYYDPRGRPIFNQSSNVITVETDQGITGIGEGGSKDTVEQLGAMIIGEDPTRIEHLWQIMYRGYFYPRPAARRFMRWAASTWRCGTSRARRSASLSTNFWAG